MDSITKMKLSTGQLNSISEKVWDENIKKVTELKDGWFNTAYDVETLGGHKGIIKIAPPKDIEVMSHEKDIIEAEVSAMKKIEKEASVPIPSIYLYDKSYNIVESKYFVMEKLEGITYNHAKDNLAKETRVSIEKRLGEYNRQINNIKSSKYGLFADSSKEFDNWFLCYKDLASMLLHDGERRNVDIGMPYSNIISLIDSLKDVLMVVNEPCLVHSDLWDGNFLVNEGKITGLIDFERCLWGDNLMEVYFWVGDYTNFIKGYGKNAEQEKYFDIRRNLYAFHMALAMVIECAYRMYDDKHIQWVRNHFKSKHENLLKSTDEAL